MKALDIYLAVCFFMVFGALLEYAIVSYTGKRIILHQRQFAEFKKKVKKQCSKVYKIILMEPEPKRRRLRRFLNHL
jgi:hypothetical protein